MPGSIFDDSFQTAIPQLDTKSIWAASILRNNALDFTPITKSFKEIGKVFTDAEDNLKKYNTASLTSYLDTMPWEARLRLQKTGINPAMLLAKEGIPVDLADKELSKAYKDSYDNARQNYTADWIAKTLPSIPYQDWISYMMGERPDLFADLNENADLVNNKDFRDALTGRLQSAANQFLISFDADHKITPQRAVAENKTIDQLRWEEANDAERSVLQHATNQFGNDLQLTTTSWADAAVADANKGQTPEKRAAGTVQNVNATVPKEGYKQSDNLLQKYLREFVPLYKEYVDDPNRTEFDNRYDVSFSEFAKYNLTEQQMREIQEAGYDLDTFTEDLGKAAETFDYKKNWTPSYNQTWGTYPQNPSLEQRRAWEFRYRKYNTAHPELAKQLTDTTVALNVEGVKKQLSKQKPDLVKQLTDPKVKKEAVNAIKQYLEDNLKRNYGADSLYYKVIGQPVVNAVIQSYAEDAKSRREVDKGIADDVMLQAEERLNNSSILMASGTKGGLNLLDNESMQRRVSRVNYELENALPPEVKVIYENTPPRGQKRILALALRELGGRDSYYLDPLKDQEAKARIVELGGDGGNQRLKTNEFLQVVRDIYEAETGNAPSSLLRLNEVLDRSTGNISRNQ